MIKHLTIISALSLLLLTHPAQAQERWSFEVRGNGALPTQDLGSDPLDTGFGFEGNVGYRFLPHLSGYLGWSWTKFGADHSFAGSDMDFEETGYAFGFRFEHPLQGESGNGMAYWIRGGGTYNHIEVEDTEGEIISDSGHGLGWEAGAGLSLPLGSTWRLTPGVRYRALSRDLSVDAVDTEIDLTYLALEIGFRRNF